MMSRRTLLAPLYSLLLFTGACTGTAVTTGTTVSGCGSAGANDNEHDVGDEPGGVALDLGEVAVAPSGAFVIFKGANDLMVGWPAEARVARLSVKAPTKLAFSKKRSVVYVGSARDGRIHAVDVGADEELWSAPVGGGAMSGARIAASKDDARLLVTTGSHLDILDTKTGDVVAQRDFAAPVVDVQILPDDERALVATHEIWPPEGGTPTAEIAVIAIHDGTTSVFDVPNCASALAITPDGKRAFLSPTFCNRDPISLLDLTPGAEGWVRNLPGFGPLALGPNGATAVAFLDAQNVDVSLFDDPAQIPPHGAKDPRFYIMTLDTQSLKYDFTAYGDDIPRYQLTPDGRALLVDSPWGSSQGQATTRVFDTQTRSFHDLAGAAVTLDDFVITDDSRHVYAAGVELVDIDLGASKATKLDTDGAWALNINISPDGKTLYLREDVGVICVYDVAAQACSGTFTAPQP